MKKLFIVVPLLFLSINNSFSQLPNQGTILLRNPDTYASYSALWGYSDSNGREYAILGTESWAVYKFPSGKIIGSDISNGLFVIKTTFPLTDVTNNTAPIAKGFTLDQNYPNPFNPVTNLEFCKWDLFH